MDIKELNIKAVILISSLDFGRCPIASKLPPAMWPIEGKPALEHLLTNLEQQGIKQVVLRPNGDSSYLKDVISGFDSMDIKVLDEPLPVGTAGCIRDAADKNKNEIFLVLKGTTLLLPDIDILMQIHQMGQSDLTIIFNSSQSSESEIYECNSDVLKFIPKQGYFDIKEGLIPALTRVGRTVHAATLPEPIGSFRDRAGYLNAIELYLQNKLLNLPDSINEPNKLYFAESAKIAPDAKIFGPAIVMDDANIAQGAVIFGPAIIGRNVSISRNTFIENTVLWDNSQLGCNCQLRNCLIDQNTTVPSYTNAANTVIANSQTALKNVISKVTRSIVEYCGCMADRIEINLKIKIPYLDQIQNLRSYFFKLMAVAILFAIFSWSYWPEFTELWHVWNSSDEYSSGILVPFLATYILWTKRKDIAQCPIQYSLLGLLTFIGSQFLRYFGMFFMFSAVERLSLVLSLAALFLLLFGRKLFCKIAFVFVFLCLMLPFPRSVHTSIMLPLQNLATSSAAFCLETLGFAATRQGNVLYINDIAIAVAEACNGLRMVTSFFIIVGLMMFMVQRTWWEKFILFSSALPIAIICNTIRLTVTAIFFATFQNSLYGEFFHTFGGYAMMPLAIAMVVFELWLLARLTTEPNYQKKQIIIQRSALA